jgi:hypothetical protein
LQRDQVMHYLTWLRSFENCFGVQMFENKFRDFFIA